MGHTRTPKFELQIEDKNERGIFRITGVDSLKEAMEWVLFYEKRGGFGRVLLWGNSASGKSFIGKHGGNYLYLMIDPSVRSGYRWEAFR